VQKYVSVTNHVYSPWIVMVRKKYWDGLSKDEQKVLMDAAKASREFERKDTREEASKTVAEFKAKGMLVNDVSPVEVGRMRDKLTRVNATIAANVGMDLLTEAQSELAKLRVKK
jgi:TRAP-type C4-dicarboxylate transport system substrate-binding protein